MRIGFHCKQAARLGLVAFRFPRALLAASIMKLRKLPMLGLEYERRSDAGRPNREGYADGQSRFSLLLLKRPIIEVVLSRGDDLAAYHFFLARSVRRLFTQLGVIQDTFGLEFNKDVSSFVEIGCGSGRCIGALIDAYGGKGVGIDGYMDALTVAKAANIGTHIDYSHCSVVTGTEVLEYIPPNVDLVLFSSVLVHIPGQDGRRKRLLDAVKQVTRFMIGIERYDAQLKAELEDRGVRVAISDEEMLFFWSDQDVRCDCRRGTCYPPGEALGTS